MGYFDSTSMFVERLDIPDGSEGVRMVAVDPAVAEAPVWVGSQAWPISLRDPYSGLSSLPYLQYQSDCTG
jgi:hypothetical protein